MANPSTEPDRIVAVEVRRCVQPQQDPAWRFALGGIPRLDGLIVSLHAASGAIGEGHIEAMAFYADDLRGSEAAIEVLRPVLLGADPLRYAETRDRLDKALSGHEAVKAGIDSALHELAARLCVYRCMSSSAARGVRASSSSASCRSRIRRAWPPMPPSSPGSAIAASR